MSKLDVKPNQSLSSLELQLELKIVCFALSDDSQYISTLIIIKFHMRNIFIWIFFDVQFEFMFQNKLARIWSESLLDVCNKYIMFQMQKFAKNAMLKNLLYISLAAN